MSNSLRNVVAAELGKLRTLPAAPITMVSTALGTTGLAVVLAAQTPGTGLHAIRYGQIGFILLGVLAAASEYSGGQIRTTLAGVPSRTLLMAGKTIAYSMFAALTAVVTVVASAVAAQAVVGRHGVPVSDFFAAQHLGPLLGAAAYLVLIGLLAHAVAFLTRNLVAALVSVLTLVLVVSPLLMAMTPLAGYLPDQAGATLYLTDPVATDVLTSVQGAGVLGAWVALALVVAVVVFTRRDA
ncbi:hypothetical protein ACQPZF_12900 [Actinosynnema sp. CS-041913]|uniref:hypothetical protein n=1 Tax=Actinosynnema sp. CS-041913 TaxID=3239917 RepID=UPI003D927F51